MSRIAAVQMESKSLDREHNLARILAKMNEVVQHRASLAVFPECVLSGYMLTAEEADAVAEPIPGPATRRLSEACEQTGLMVVVGMLEKDAQGQCFNSAVLVGGRGVYGVYRKAHLPYLGVDRYLAAGDSLAGPFETPLGRLGLLICYDLRFPEATRVLALAGTQVVALSTAWPRAATLYPDWVAQTRAAENGLYLVAANRSGEERGTAFLGRSIICGPDGEVLAEAPADEEATIVADIEPDRSTNKRRVFVPGQYELDLMADRRPELYGSLTSDRPST